MAKDINKVIMDSLQIDDEGMKTVKTFSMEELSKLGVKDLPSFLSGLLDAENDKEFNDSNEDYVKGYKYGRTGKF